ncbi:MAG: ATP-dependent DNA helicase [Lamprobacter sp.]|uniref:ATP-dependent DNA helicase n=1 Tax=Lamprobacter sp. TaxID=3100796 RepID=UPI002B256E3A|nr:ATP-dependent DNA helicase [Lamprobacter sp.]MEA3638975.1 ATP-dependent DNA helicase [Lamprobacter sp.]
MDQRRSDRAGPVQQAVQLALAVDGPLAERLQHFHPRPQQQAMAQSVAEILERGGALICEAGTGTGKTFAYLVPALLSGRKAVISTGTRNLQDQLFQRDIPLIRAALGAPIQVALLKGRGNYLCRYRLALAIEEPTRYRSEVRAHLQQVRDWSRHSQQGDIAELPIPENDPVWPAVTSTADNCLGQNCPVFNDCHLLEARRRAQAAELVVVNHHLLCADLALRDEGFGEVLPAADAFIIDEAHQLPEVAAHFFGVSISARQLVELARDVAASDRRDAGDVPDLPLACDALQQAVAELRASLSQDLGYEDRRGPWQQIAEAQGVQVALERLAKALETLTATLEPIAERSRGLEQAAARVMAMRARLDNLLADELSPEQRHEPRLKQGQAKAAGRVEREHQLEPPESGRRQNGSAFGGEPNRVRWFDLQGRNFRFHQTPLDVSAVFRQQRHQHPAAWILTSATLSVGRSFAHFASRVGCEDAETAQWDSPFDYPQQALLYCPDGMPEPSHPGYNARVIEVARAVLSYSQGRAFLLFTSHRALCEAASQLQSRLDYPLLVQGSAPRAELIERFRELGNAVLLGTSSFWEGVDVRGEALSCVIIDKLPFSSPADPILQARADALRRQGGNPFRDFQLPQAVIALKQGAGRLIRDPQDRGLLVVCDPRLHSRSYGRIFLNSLPPMRRTKALDDLEAFFASPAS